VTYDFWITGLLFLADVKDFCLHHCVETRCVTHTQPPIQWGCLPDEAWNSILYTAKVKNAWKYLSISAYFVVDYDLV